MKTTAQLIAESKELRFSFRKPDGAAETLPRTDVLTSLPWLHSYYQVLAPVGYYPRDCVLHLYYDEYPRIPAEKAPDNITVIIHGHSRTMSCFANTLCHVKGYKPNAEEFTPALQRIWDTYGY